MKYFFGPVPGRGLDQSPGIDMIPTITGNLNCVYGQSGRSWSLLNAVAGEVVGYVAGHQKRQDGFAAGGSLQVVDRFHGRFRGAASICPDEA